MRIFTLQINNIPHHVTTQSKYISDTNNKSKMGPCSQEKTLLGIFDLPDDLSLGIIQFYKYALTA